MKDDQQIKMARKNVTQLFVEELPVLRAKIGISQEELTEYVGISRQTLLSIEPGKREIPWSAFLSMFFYFTFQQKTNGYLDQIPDFNKTLFVCLDYNAVL